MTAGMFLEDPRDLECNQADFDTYHVCVTRWPMKHILIAAVLLAIELRLQMTVHQMFRRFETIFSKA